MKKKSRPWVRRHLQTFPMNGRPRRGLLWKKAVYKEWFEYSKLAGTYPKEFGNLAKYKTFEEWWRDPDYGFELFCEPVEEPPVVEEQGDSIKRVEGRIYLSIDPNADPTKVNFALKGLVKKKVKGVTKIVSHARFQPSKPSQRIRVEKLERFREAWRLQNVEGLTRREIAERLMKRGLYGVRKNGEPQEPDLREVTRDIANARGILKRVEKGVFP